MDRQETNLEFNINIVPQPEYVRLLERFQYWIDRRLGSLNTGGMCGLALEEKVIIELCHRVLGIEIPEDLQATVVPELIGKLKELGSTCSVSENGYIFDRVILWLGEHYHCL